MDRRTSLRPRMIMGAALTLTGLTAACAHVGQEQFDTEIAALRAEIEQNSGDSNRRTQAQLAQLEAQLDGLARGLTQLEREFDVTVQRLETSVRFDMPVYFDFDKANLRPEDLPVLDRFAGVVGEYYPDALLTVEGFTDPSGSATYNLALGQRRAEAVQRYLIDSEDFAPEFVRAVSYGEDAGRLVAPGQGGPEGVGRIGEWCSSSSTSATGPTHRSPPRAICSHRSIARTHQSPQRRAGPAGS